MKEKSDKKNNKKIDCREAWYHVTNSAAAGQTIFHNRIYFEIFLELLEEVFNIYQVEIHAYCLMNNNYHLLIKLNYDNLSEAMRHLNGLFARRHNSMQDKDGPVFKSRYKAFLVKEDHYLLLLSRRIHLNPVASKLCQYPEQYLWSSYRYYLEIPDRPRWMFCDAILDCFQPDIKIECYKQFVLAGQSDLKALSFKEIKILAQYQNRNMAFEEDKLFCKNKIIGQKEKNIIFNTIDLERTEINEKTHSIANTKTHTAASKTASTQMIASKMEKINTIISKIAQYYQVDPLLIQSNKYKTALNHPRKVAIYMLSQVFHIERRIIALAIHNISIDGITKVSQRMKLKIEEDQDLSSEILRIKAYLL